MNYTTIVGGAACGVVVLLCLPVCGAVGSVTALGAIIGASCGGGAGALASRGRQSATAQAEARGRRAGERQAKAEQAVRQQQYAEAFERQDAELDAHRLHDELALSLIAYGLACAGAHASNPAIVEAVKEFACGQAIAGMPAETQRQIEALVANPPGIEAARQRASALPDVPSLRFDEMQQLVATLLPAAAAAAA